MRGSRLYPTYRYYNVRKVRLTSEVDDGVPSDEEQAELAVEPEAEGDLRGVGLPPDRGHRRGADGRDFQDI